MIKAKIATPEKEIFNGDLNKIIISTSTGEISILSGHEPLISTIESGQIIIEKEDGQREIFSGFNGLVNIENHKGKTNVKVLIESSEDVNSLDLIILEESIKRAKEANKEKMENFGLEINSELLKDLNRLKLARRYNK